MLPFCTQGKKWHANEPTGSFLTSLVHDLVHDLIRSPREHDQRRGFDKWTPQFHGSRHDCHELENFLARDWVRRSVRENFQVGMPEYEVSPPRFYDFLLVMSTTLFGHD